VENQNSDPLSVDKQSGMSFLQGVLVFVLFAVCFFIIQRFTFTLRFPPFNRTTLWTPGALTFAALLLTPASRWWIFYLSLCVAGFTAYIGDPAIPAWHALLAAQFHFFAVVIGVRAVRRFSPDPLIGNPPALLCFVIVAGLVVPVATTFPIDFLRWLRNAEDVLPTAIRSMLCVSLGLVIATPAVTLSIVNFRSWIRQISWPKAIEIVSFAVLLVGIGYLVFGHPAGTSLSALLYAPVPLLLWAALRFGLAGLCWALLAVAYQSTWNAIEGNGPFVGGASADNVLHMQLYILVSSLPLMFLAVVIEQRSSAFEQLAIQEGQVSSQLAQLRTIYQTAPIGLGFVDTHQRIVSINDRLAEISGILAADQLGKTYQQVLPILSSTAEPIYRTSFETAQPVIESEVHGATAKQPGVERDWLVSHYPVKDPQGRPLGVSTVVEEITERKRAERLRQELIHASRLALLGEFTASIAHEINQPLGAILSNVDAAEMMLDGSPEAIAEIRNILVDIRRDNLRASEVIRRLRNLIRNDEVECKPLSLEAMITETLGLIGGDAQRRGIGVHVQLDQNLPTIQGDKIHLQQVLINLLVNAMEALGSLTPNREPRRIDVAANRDRDDVIVSVRDNGPGVPSEKIATVFDHFFTTKQEGMGLGLAISRSLVERHGGRIWVDNAEGGGAIFRFSLPIESTDSAESGAEATYSQQDSI
jgi:PAS domain S-box-containing protein